MLFAPHILQQKETLSPKYDKYGRVIATTEHKWVNICSCRCDDNTTREFTSVNGSVFRPNFHIVCNGENKLKAGDIIRCLQGENVICQGEVLKVTSTNWFNYTEVWI